jgi:hypothetical protein
MTVEEAKIEGIELSDMLRNEVIREECGVKEDVVTIV